VGFDILVSDETAKTLPGYALLDAGALPLRGKSGRTKPYAVVGDERIGSLKEFSDLNLVHEQLIATLHLRAAARRKNIALAKLKAAPLGAVCKRFMTQFPHVQTISSSQLSTAEIWPAEPLMAVMISTTRRGSVAAVLSHTLLTVISCCHACPL
jgi:hypothetical protein